MIKYLNGDALPPIYYPDEVNGVSMDLSNSKLSRAFSKLMRVLPLLCMAAAIIWFFTAGRDLSVEDILSYTPKEPILAALFIWLAFAIKSLSVMFPVLLLFAVTGRLFPFPAALLINTVGIAVTLSLPYFIGRFSGGDMTERLMVKYPKLSELRELRSRNGFFFSFLVRAVGVLPCDVVSLYMGNTRLPYVQYITGGVLGFMPDLICATIVGMKITDASSPWFWGTIGVNLLICGLSCLLYRQYSRKASGTQKM